MSTYDRMNQLQRAIQDASLQKAATAQNDPDKQIAEAEAELATLRQQEREAALNAAVAGNEHLLHEIDAAWRVLADELDRVVSLINSVAAPADELEGAIRWQRNSMEQAIGNYADRWNTKEHIRNLNHPDALVSEKARADAQFDIHSARARFGKPLSRDEMLAQWVSAAPNAQERQKRSGVILALFGRAY